MRKEEVLFLPKPANIAATQAFTDLGFGIRAIADILDIDQKTVMRYRAQELDSEWEQFSSSIKKVYLEQDFELAQLAVSHIKQKIDKARFFELVGLLKTVRELQQPKTPQAVVNTQTNIVAGVPEVLADKYDKSS